MSDIVPVGRTERPSSHPIVRGATLIKDMARLQQIASVAVKHGLGEVLERMNLQDSAIVAILQRGKGKDRPTTTMPERVRLFLEELGPTFVKLGQVLSTRPDLVPKEYVDQLRLLQSDVPAAPFAEVRPDIEAAIGRPFDEVFQSFDEEPVAAASVAQVYRAELVTGEVVAVKALRPGVRRVVEADVGVMELLAGRLESAFAEARALNLSGMVREFERALRRELDLRNEARNLDAFRAMFEGRADIHIPAAHPELTDENVLIMEFIRGQKITEAAKSLPEERRNELVASCFDILFTMVLVERLFHGDLHPGNVMLTDDGAVALLDVGLVGRLSPTMRDQVVDLLLALTQRDWQSVADSFYEMAVRTRPVNLREFAAEVADVLDSTIAGRTVDQLELGSVLAHIGTIGVRFGMRVPSEYAMMIKAVLTVEGLGRDLATGVDPVEAARPYVTAAIKERYGPERLGTEGVRTLLSLSRLAREMPPTLREMVASIEGGRVRLGVDLSSSRDLAPTLTTALAPVTDAVLTTGLLVAGALALSHGEALILGIPAVSLALFTFAGGAAVRLALRLRRK